MDALRGNGLDDPHAGTGSTEVMTKEVTDRALIHAQEQQIYGLNRPTHYTPPLANTLQPTNEKGKAKCH